MIVLNEQKLAFRDMTVEEKLAIIDAKLFGTCEVCSGGEWYPALYDDTVCLNTVYRTRPRQLVIPWEVIKPEYKWAAMDENGAVFVYEYNMPHLGSGLWIGDGSCISSLNIDTTGIDWRESLTQRPEE